MKLSCSAAVAIGLSLAVSTQAATPKPTPTPAPKPGLLDRLLHPFGDPKEAAPKGKATPSPSRRVAKPKAEPKKKPDTLPPTSKMIVVPPPTDPAGGGNGEPPKLISSEMTGKDLQFFTSSVEAGRYQSYLVDLLQAKAASDQIKALGSALATTQQLENKQITRLAALKGWTVSTEPTAAEKAFGAKLEKLEGSDFDKAVMDKVIAVAQQAVAAYAEAAQSSDKDIQDFSTQMLPLAQEKLKFAEKMTGAGKSATQLFRTGTPANPSPTETPPATPAPQGKPLPPPITPSKSKSSATSAKPELVAPSPDSKPPPPIAQ